MGRTGGISTTPDERELRDIWLCAELYYSGQKTQPEIATQLRFSISKVSRLLKSAERNKIVETKLNPPNLTLLAGKLRDQYALRDAVVIPAPKALQMKEGLGLAAAHYFESIAVNGQKVGISAGATLLHMVQNLTANRFRSFRIYPLFTTFTPYFVDIIPNTLVGMMAAKYSPHVYAYALNFSKRRDPEMEKVYQESLDIDLAILGAGALEDVSPGFSQLLERCGLSTERLLQSGAVGEFNSQLITAEGEEFRYPKHIQSLTSRLRTVPLKQLRKLSMHGQKRVIAICGGVAKKNVVQSVLAGRYCNTLITDEELATALLSTKGG